MMRPLIIAILSLFYFSATAQESNYQFNFIGKEDQITVPFEYKQGFIILEVTLNGKDQLNLILDTGAENIILFKYYAIDKYDLTVSKDIKLVGSDLEQVVEASICRSNKVKLETGVAFSNDLIVLKEDILALDQLTGLPIDGILGGRAFWGQTIEIDYIKEELTIYKSKSAPQFAHDLNYQSYPVTLENHKPYIYLTYRDHNEKAIDLKVLMDTGSALGLLLFSHADSTLNLPPAHIRAALGKGIGGDIMGYIGRLPKVELSEVFFFNNMVAYFQDIEEDLDPDIYAERLGLIGNPLLSRFDVVIDYLNCVAYLKTNERYGDDWPHDLSGLQIFATGRNLREFVVNAVFERSPAKEAGFQKGDIIKRIGIWGANQLSMSSLGDKLSKRVGKKVRIVVTRDGKKLVKKIKLKDYLSP
jgi:hypothetical protein